MRLAMAGAMVCTLAACDNPITCPKTCPNPAHSRDFFCGCFDPKANETKQRQSSPSGPLTAYAQCVCKYSSGLIGAWFNYEPSNYNQFGTVNVSASSCTDLKVCERTETGQGGYSYTFLTGKISLSAESWNRVDNYITGGSSWYVLGKQQQKSSSVSEPPTVLPLGTRFAIRLNHLLRSIRQTAFTNDPEGCRSACSAGSPYCLTESVGGPQADGLRRLHALVAQQPAEISPQDIQKMFGIVTDPCRRQETIINNSMLSNYGDVCSLQAPINQANIVAKISIPSTLQGRLQVIGSDIDLFFDDVESRPILTLSDAFLNADWGGGIKSVFSDNNSLGFAVGSESCIRAILID